LFFFFMPPQPPRSTLFPYTTLFRFWEKRIVEHPPMHTYKWADTERALTNLAQVDASPFDDVALEYVNPQTGGSVMPSFTAWIQMLRPGIQTQTHRHVSSAVYHVFEGRGATIIN